MTWRRFCCIALSCVAWITSVRAGDPTDLLRLTLELEVDDCAAFEETAVLEAYCEAFVLEADFPDDTACLTDQSGCLEDNTRRQRRRLQSLNEARIVLGGVFGILTRTEVRNDANAVLQTESRLDEVKALAVANLTNQGQGELATLLSNTGITGIASSVMREEPECNESGDCDEDSTRPFCQSGFCVACSPISLPAKEGNCPSSRFCRNDGSCSMAQCETDDDCWGDAPICQEHKCIGANYVVENEAALRDALHEAKPGDSIQVVETITLNDGTLTISKPVSIVGKRDSVLQSPADDTAELTFILVEADDVSFSRGLRIRHLKTNPATTGSAFVVDAMNFVSAADVEFVEFAYTLKGSFNVSGTTNYVGASGNTNRHFIIYSLRDDSAIQDLVFDFPQANAGRSIFILARTGGIGNEFAGSLTVKNVHQADQGYACRNFFNFDSLSSIDTDEASLRFDNNAWNDSGGGIFLYLQIDNPLELFQSVVIANNVQGDAGASGYKGLFYISGDGQQGLTVGNVSSFQAFGNDSPGQQNPGILRDKFHWLNVPGQQEYTFAVDSRIYDYP